MTDTTHVQGYRKTGPTLDQAEVDALADLIERVRARPGITGADVLADAIIRAGWRHASKTAR
jgi:hypothetical protein